MLDVAGPGCREERLNKPPTRDRVHRRSAAVCGGWRRPAAAGGDTLMGA
ncbi:hypothetical protein [Streptomyces phaeochromogenes]|nr:hypothetical protein [Streptomyces phaeochromogenes]